jgi:hypothetical protein
LTQIATLGLDEALAQVAGLRSGTYLYRGKCVQETLARVFGVPLEKLPVGA